MSRRVNYFIDLTLCQTVPGFNDPQKAAYRKHCRKRRKNLVKGISTYAVCFPFHQGRILSSFIVRLQMLSIWIRLKLCRW